MRNGYDHGNIRSVLRYSMNYSYVIVSFCWVISQDILLNWIFHRIHGMPYTGSTTYELCCVLSFFFQAVNH